MAGPSPDFTVTDQGSLVLLFPETPNAVQWCDDNLPVDAQRFGRAIVIEHRYANDILEGITNDDLTCEAA